MAKITDWCLFRDLGMHICLVGRIADHDRQDEFKKEFQITSPIVDIDTEGGTATTQSGTVYVLGKPWPTTEPHPLEDMLGRMMESTSIN